MGALRLFRAYSALTFSFAWVPVMFLAFTRDRGFSPEQYGQLWSLYYLAMVLAEVPWGRAADRWGARPLLVGGPLLLALSFLLLGHATGFGWCALAMVGTGVAHAMISGADSAWLYETLEAAGRRLDALREEALAHRWRLFGVSAADLAGGLVAFSFGTSAAFDLSVLIMLGAAGLAAALPSPRPAPQERCPTFRPGMLAQLRRPGVPWVLGWYVAVFVLLRVGFQLYQPTLLAIGTEDVRLHGALLACLNLLAGLAAMLVLRVHERWGERGTTSGVLAMLLLSFLGLATLPGALAVAALCALQQVSFGFLQPVGRTALNQRVPAGDRAALLSAQSMLARLAFSLVMALLPWDRALADGLGTTYLCLALAALLCAVASTRLHPSGEGRALESPLHG